MLQKLPPRFGVHEVIKLLDNSGLGDEYYDFFYMPHCKGATRSKCFAFINIPDSATATEFVKRFDGKEVEGRKKRMLVVRAAHQGVIANLSTINHTAWSRLEQLPMVRIDGRRLHVTPEAGLNMYHEMTSGERTTQVYAEHTKFDFELLEATATESTCNLLF
jgi:hypothetical protein